MFKKCAPLHQYAGLFPGPGDMPVGPDEKFQCTQRIYHFQRRKYTKVLPANLKILLICNIFWSLLQAFVVTSPHWQLSRRAGTAGY
jgi:hypothetical protein